MTPAAARARSFRQAHRKQRAGPACVAGLALLEPQFTHRRLVTSSSSISITSSLFPLPQISLSTRGDLLIGTPFILTLCYKSYGFKTRDLCITKSCAENSTKCNCPSGSRGGDLETSLFECIGSACWQSCHSSNHEGHIIAVER